MAELDDAALGGEQDTLDDTMSAIFDKMEAEDAAEGVAGQAGADGEETDGADAGGQRRDPATGRFTKAEGADQGDAATTDTGDEPEKGQEGQDGAKGAEAAPEPPASWSAEEKAEFAKLPPELQRIVARRESDREKAFFGKTQELADQRKRFDRLEQVIGSRREAWLRNGMDEATAIGQLIVLGEYADRDFAGFVRHLAQARNFDLAQLYEDPADRHDDDPRYSALEKQVQSLTRTLTDRQDAEARAAQAEQDRTLSAFASDPKHPHFESVRPEMAAILRAAHARGKVMTLEEAYAEACWANSEVRKQLQADEEKAKAAAREAEEKRRAKEARDAAGTRLRGMGSMPGRPAKGSIDDTMSEAFDRLSAA